jgi:hypothetical protein
LKFSFSNKNFALQVFILVTEEKTGKIPKISARYKWVATFIHRNFDQDKLPSH